MALYLVPKAEGRPIVVDKAVLFVGRHPDCDVILTKSRKVSRKHCCLAQVDDKFFLRDLGSMNGVAVNGQRVKREAPVNVGDEILVGDVPFVLQADEGRRRPKRWTMPEPAEPVAAPQPVAPPMVERTEHSADELSREFPVPIRDEGVSFKVESGGSKGDHVGGTLDDSAESPVVYDDDDGSLPDA